MEIDITNFVTNADPFKFFASAAERGSNAARETWSNAQAEAELSPLLITLEQIDALRDHIREFGGWSDDEIDAWDAVKCNAIFIQLISGDMREAGMDECDADEFDWTEYENRDDVSHNIYRGDDECIYYYLGI